VREESSQSPVPDAQVTVRLAHGEDDEPRELFSASTDRDGFVEACFEIPEPVDGGAEIVFAAIKGAVEAQLKKPVKRG
jgi:hypothetical protein